MHLVIDIGNTVAKLVAFSGDEPVEESITDNRTLAGLPKFASRYEFSRGIYSSVVELSPDGFDKIKSLPVPMMQLRGDTPVPLEVCYHTPRTLGADRLAAAVGAATLMPGKNLLVIDAGTCLTYEIVTADGRYLGGNISPGLQMRLHALHEHTSRLPIVDAVGETPLVGIDTHTAIRSGVIRGMQYEIEGYIRLFGEKYASLCTFLTGGDLFDFDNRIKSIIFADKFLVPRGLNRILEYNQ